MKTYERFLKYVAFPTMSSEESTSSPSTKKQLALGEFLVEELRGIGLTDARMDEFGYVYASLDATCEGFYTLGLIAHMDTSPDMPDENIKARIIEYTGGDITLNEELGIVMHASEYSSLEKHIGERLIITDGTTLLGADDKAGVAEIISAVERIKNSNTPHGKILVAFTPDEEVGRGTKHFNLKDFPADFAYTLDGGALGELEYENFNAASAKIKVKGFSTHPGSAKNKMKNAVRIATEFNSLLPEEEIPELTEGYEGFHHLVGMSGHTTEAELAYIIRDHDKEKFVAKKNLFTECARKINEKYGEGTLTLQISDSYYNMKDVVDKYPHTVALAKNAMLSLGITPIVTPIRGGTDGASLSHMGLPTPNLCTGGENFHSGFEFVSIDSMDTIVELIETIIKTAKKVNKS